VVFSVSVVLSSDLCPIAGAPFEELQGRTLFRALVVSLNLAVFYRGLSSFMESGRFQLAFCISFRIRLCTIGTG